eukprot:7385423-Prymnesium_polylepis.2
MSVHRSFWGVHVRVRHARLLASPHHLFRLPLHASTRDTDCPPPPKTPHTISACARQTLIGKHREHVPVREISPLGSSMTERCIDLTHNKVPCFAVGSSHPKAHAVDVSGPLHATHSDVPGPRDSRSQRLQRHSNPRLRSSARLSTSAGVSAASPPV